MSRQLPEAAEILSHYDLGKVVSLRRLTESYANWNFALTTDRGRFLYRVCRQNTRDRIKQEMRIMEILRRESFPAAYPMPRCDGGFISQCDEGPVLLWDFVDGHVPELNTDTTRQIARALATLNSIRCPADLDVPNFISIDACIAFVEQCQESDRLDPDVVSAFAARIRELEPILRRPLPRGLIHSDVFPDNTLFAGDDLRAIIDFEEACTDHFLFEIGMTIHGFCYDDACLHPRRLAAFVDSYNEIRPLRGAERELLPAYVRWTGLGMVYWHLTHLVHTPNQRQWDRVRTLMRRVEALEDDDKDILPSIIR